MQRDFQRGSYHKISPLVALGNSEYSKCISIRTCLLETLISIGTVQYSKCISIRTCLPSTLISTRRLQYSNVFPLELAY